MPGPCTCLYVIENDDSKFGGWTKAKSKMSTIKDIFLEALSTLPANKGNEKNVINLTANLPKTSCIARYVQIIKYDDGYHTVALAQGDIFDFKSYSQVVDPIPYLPDIWDQVTEIIIYERNDPKQIVWSK